MVKHSVREMIFGTFILWVLKEEVLFYSNISLMVAWFLHLVLNKYFVANTPHPNTLT